MTRPASVAAAWISETQVRALDLIDRERRRRAADASKALRSGLVGVQLARLDDQPGRFGRAIEDGLQRADDVVAAVEDAQRDHRLAAEERSRKRFVGDAAGIGGNLVGAEAQHRVAAAALQGDALERGAPAR